MKRSVVWFIAMLVGGYVCLQLVADVAASKIAQVGPFTLPAGTFVFALTFTWRDMIHKKLGKEWARAAIIIAAGCNVFMAAYFLLAIRLNPAVFWPNQEAFSAVLGLVPRIAIASILAELVSELIDTEVYHALIHRISERHQWARVLISNGVALPIDSAIFATIAFAGVMPLAAIVATAVGQVFFKFLITVVSLPLIYLIKGDHGKSLSAPLWGAR